MRQNQRYSVKGRETASQFLSFSVSGLLEASAARGRLGDHPVHTMVRTGRKGGGGCRLYRGTGLGSSENLATKWKNEAMVMVMGCVYFFDCVLGVNERHLTAV